MKIFAKIITANDFIRGIDAIGFDEHKKLFKFNDGDYVEIITWKERDINKHRKYMALMNCTLYHMRDIAEYSFLNSLETLRKSVQICIGNCDLAYGMDGQPQLQAHSISFKSMDQEEFDNVYNKSLNFIVKTYLNHISYKDFINDIINFY